MYPVGEELRDYNVTEYCITLRHNAEARDSGLHMLACGALLASSFSTVKMLLAIGQECP